MSKDFRSAQIIAFGFALALPLCLLAPTAHGHDELSVARGSAMVDRLCVGCHGRDGQSIMTIQGVPVPSFGTIASRPDLTPERLVGFLLTPHRPMPAIPLDLIDIKDIVAYIASLRN